MTAIALAEIAQLSLSERIQLVEDIWDTVAAAPDDLDLTDPQREELERRLQDYRQNPQIGSSWQEVSLRIRGQKWTRPLWYGPLPKRRF
jgi:putative addiction module component (TIGR02574 family)